MDWWVLEMIWFAGMVFLALWLGPFIRRFGKSYAADVFRANPRTGKSFIVLMDVAYYLIFFAFILFTVQFEPASDWAQTVNAEPAAGDRGAHRRHPADRRRAARPQRADAADHRADPHPEPPTRRGDTATAAGFRRARRLVGPITRGPADLRRDRRSSCSVPDAAPDGSSCTVASIDDDGVGCRPDASDDRFPTSYDALGELEPGTVLRVRVDGFEPFAEAVVDAVCASREGARRAGTRSRSSSTTTARHSSSTCVHDDFHRGRDRRRTLPRRRGAVHARRARRAARHHRADRHRLPRPPARAGHDPSDAERGVSPTARPSPSP